jgi:hypothetical protein
MQRDSSVRMADRIILEEPCAELSAPHAAAFR